MARFSKNTLVQIAGFSNDVLCEELLFGQDSYWNLNLTDGTTANGVLDLTDWTFKLRLIRRSVTAITDTRNGIEIEGLGAVPGAAEQVLDDSVKVYDPVNGKVRILIDDTFFSTVQPAIDSETPPVYTGYFGATAPEVGQVGDLDYIPPQQKKILLCFIINSDGISSQTA
jgi:hypothetical protein